MMPRLALLIPFHMRSFCFMGQWNGHISSSYTGEVGRPFGDGGIGVLGSGQLIRILQVEPQLRAGAEREADLLGGFGGDPLLSTDDLVDRLKGASNDLGQISLRAIADFKLFADEFAGGEDVRRFEWD